MENDEVFIDNLPLNSTSPINRLIGLDVLGGVIGLFESKYKKFEKSASVEKYFLDYYILRQNICLQVCK